MDTKSLLKKYALVVYVSIFLSSIILLLLALLVFYEDEDTKGILINLATELLGAAVIYFVVQKISGIDENQTIEDKVDKIVEKLDEDSIESKIDTIIQEFDDNKNYKIIDKNNDALNEKFYKYFNEKILDAKNSIFMTGDGFEFPDKKDNRDKLKLAENFIAAQRRALINNPNLHIVRLQTEANASKEWNVMLKELVEEFPKRFQLHLKTNIIKSESIASVCTIDKDDDINNITEFMFSTKSAVGNDNIAGLSIFVRGNTQLCNNVQTYIINEIEDKLTIDINPDNFDLHMTKSVLYFAYGSNMDIKQMLERCPSAKKIANGYIDDYELVFNREGTIREGGVSSIVYNEEKKVYGVVYLINESDKKNLDEREKKDNAYKEKDMNVVVLDEDNKDNHKQYLECLVYISNPQEGNFKPADEYITKMITGAEYHGLPKPYVKFLKGFKN